MMYSPLQPLMHTHETEGYLIPKLAMEIWGKCTNDATYFCRDYPNLPDQLFSFVLKTMSKETVCVGLGGGVARINATSLFMSEIIDSKYPLLKA